MTATRNLLSRSLLILLLLFANSGFAAGSVGHSHSDVEDRTLSASHSANHAVSMDANANSTQSHHSTPEQEHNHESGDCLCDDLCCLSTVSLFESASESKILPDGSQIVKPRQFYQSISLDLLLPPPNR